MAKLSTGTECEAGFGVMGEDLSRRERQIATAYADGASYREIGERLFIAPTTVRTHITTIYRKLGVSSKIELLRALTGGTALVGNAAGSGARPSLAATATKPLIHVVAFETYDAEDLLFAADLLAELRTHFARLTGLILTDRRDNARYFVGGSIRLRSGRGRVYVRLSAAECGRQIWADRFEVGAEDSFDLLDRLAARIATSVRRRVAAADAASVADRDLDELSLEEVLALAGTRFYIPAREGWLEGGRIAQHALAQAPENFMALAMAAAGLGLAERLFGFRSTGREVVDLALRRVEAALRHHNRSDMAHTTRSGLLLFDGRFAEAMAGAQRSLELNADYNMGHWMQGLCLLLAGDWEGAVAAGERAVGIDPDDPYVHLYGRVAGFGHLGAGRLDCAMEWLHRCDELAPGVAPNLVGLVVSRYWAGDVAAARCDVARLLEAEPDLRLNTMCRIPFRDPGHWARYVEALREMGVPD